MNNSTSRNGGRMLTAQRRQQIADMVEENGMVNAEDLALQLDVSNMTIWRDLHALEVEGKLKRVRGGAVKSEHVSAIEPFYATKRAVNRAKKELIARYAAQKFVQDNDILILEAGTTATAMVKHLDQQNLTIVTNGLGTINEVAPLVPRIMAICCGGILREISWTFVGPEAVHFFEHLRARTLFLSATGFTLPEGITDPNPLENQVKSAMAASAERAILLIDSSKFGMRSLSRILPLEAIHGLVTDAEAPPDILEQVLSLGIEVHIAE